MHQEIVHRSFVKLSHWLSAPEFLWRVLRSNFCFLDPDIEDLLTLNHHLTPEDFSSSDTSSHTRWRQVQYLVNQLWVRWKREYLQTMQSRKKWQMSQENFTVDDVVIF